MRSLVRWFVLAAAVALVPVSAHQTTPIVTIEGHVVDAITSRPIRGAIVRANRGQGPRSTTPPEPAFRTGQDGRFVFRLPTGVIGLHVTKTGYLAADAVPAEASAVGQPKASEVRLTPEGLISGRAVDQFNAPIAGASIRAVERGDVVRFSSSASATTDDLGQYTIGGLDPGDYVVGIVGEKRPVYSFPTTYFPSATTSEAATVIKVEAGQERSGADIQFRFDPPLPRKEPNSLYSEASSAGTIGGIVRDGAGRGAAQTIVIIVSSQGSAVPREALTDESGRFQFPNLPPGRFVLYAARIAAPSVACCSMSSAIPSPAPCRCEAWTRPRRYGRFGPIPGAASELDVSRPATTCSRRTMISSRAVSVLSMRRERSSLWRSCRSFIPGSPSLPSPHPSVSAPTPKSRVSRWWFSRLR
jgi:hypothetical protein